jgi:hypothetical protein
MIQLSVTPADLVKFWSLPKTTDTRQLTLRVPSEVFYKLQAFEELFPNRSRNEMISDLLSTALDAAGESLPSYDGEVISILDNGEEIHEQVGPRLEFKRLCDSFRASSKPDDDKSKNALRVSDVEQDQAA